MYSRITQTTDFGGMSLIKSKLRSPAYVPSISLAQRTYRSLVSTLLLVVGQLCGSSTLGHAQESTSEAGKPRVLVGHPAPVYAATFTPDGALLASGGFDQKIKLWNVATGKELRTLEGHQGLVLSLAVSPDGHTLASGSSDNTIKLWDIPSDKPLAQWAGHADAVRAVAISSDGTYVLSAGADAKLRVWSWPSGKLLQTLPGHEAEILHTAVRGDRQLWASADATGRIRLWTPGKYLDEDPTTGLDLFGHVGPVTSLEFHPNNQQLLTSGTDGTIKVWQFPIIPPIQVMPPAADAAADVVVADAPPVELVEIAPSGTLAVVAGARDTLTAFNPASPTQLRTLTEQPGPARALAISPNAALVATGNAAGTIKLWNAADGADRLTLAGHTGSITALDFHPDNARLISAASDGTARLWRLPVPPTPITGHTAAIHDLAATRNGQFHFTAAADNSVRVWNGSNGQAVRTLAGHTSPATALALRADDAQLASADAQGVVRFWNVGNGQAEGVLGAATSPITDLAFHPESKSLVITAADGTVKVFELPLIAPKPVAGHTDAVNAVAASSDGKLLVSGSADQTVRVFNAETGAAVRQLAASVGKISAVAISPDNKMVAAGNDAGRVILRQMDNVADLGHLAGHAGVVEDVAFHPTLPQVATAGADGTVRIWEVPQPAAPLAGHTQPVRSVAASPDGSWYATSSDDKTVKLWKSADNSPLRTVANLPAAVGALAVRPDSQQIAAADDQGTVHFIKVSDGTIEKTLGAHTGVIRRVEYNASGDTLLTVCADGTAQRWNLAAPATTDLPPHAAPITAVTVSRDGKTLATSDAAGGLRLLPQPATAQSKPTVIENQRGPLTSIKFRSDDAQFAAASATGHVQVWDTKTAKLTTWFQAHGAAVHDFALHPDPQLSQLATVGEDGTLRLWNLAAQPEPAETFGQQITNMAVSPDGKRLATAGAYQGRPAILLRELASNRQLGVLLGHEGPIQSLRFSGNGLRLASGSADGSARVWDLNDPKFPQLVRFDEHEGPVTAVALSADGMVAASGATNNTLKLWHVADGTLQADLEGHAAAISDTVFSPNGATLVSAAADKTVRWWNAANGSAVRSATLPAAVTCLAMKPDGATVVAGTVVGEVNAYNVANGQAAEVFPGHATEIASLSFTPDGTKLASCSADGELRLWQADGQLLEARPWPLADTTNVASPQVALTATDNQALLIDVAGKLHTYTSALKQRLKLSEMPLTAVAYTADGSQAVVAGQDRLAKLINVADGKLVRTFTGHQDAITGLALHTPADAAQPPLLITVSLDKTLRLWNLADAAVVATLTQSAAIHELSLNESTAQVSLAGEDGMIRVIDLATQRELQRFAAHVGPVTSLAMSSAGEAVFSGGNDKLLRATPLVSERVVVADAKELYTGCLMADGTKFATAGSEPVVRIWEGKQEPLEQKLLEQKPQELAGSTAPLLSLAVSPDGTHLAAGSQDNKLHVWQLADQTLAYSVEMPAPVRQVAYLADGSRLFVASDDQRVRVLSPADGLLLDEITTATAIKSLSLVQRTRKFVASDAGNNAAVYTSPLLSVFRDHERGVAAVAWTGDGKHLFSGGADQRVRQWDIETGEIISSYASASAVQDVALSGDSQHLAAASEDGNAHVWKVSTTVVEDAAPDASFAHDGPLHAVQFSPNQQLLATCGEDGITRVWELASGRELERFFAHTGAALDVAWSPDNRTLVTSGLDKTIQILHVSATRLFPAGTGPVNAVAFVEEGKRFATGGQDGKVRIWSESGEPVELTAGDAPLVSLAYDAENNVLVAGGTDQKVHRWNLTDGAELPAIETPAAIQSLALGGTAEDRRIAVLGSDQQVRIFSDAGQLLERQSAPLPPTPEPAANAAAEESPIPPLPARQQVVLLPDNQRILFSAGNQANLSQLSLLNVFKPHDGAVTGVEFTPDGNHFLTSGQDRKIQLWNLADAAPVRSFMGATEAVTRLALSPDGKRVFAATADQCVSVWPFTPPESAEAPEPTEVQPIATFAHDSDVQSIDPTVDGSRVATAAADGIVRVWDVVNQCQLERFAGHTPGATAAGLGPDGRTLVSASASGEVRVSRISVAQVAATSVNKSGGVQSVSYASNGSLIVSVQGEVNPSEPVRAAETNESAETGEPSLPTVVQVWDAALKPSRTIAGPTGVYTSVDVRADNQQVAAGSESGRVEVWKFNDGAAEFAIRTPSAVRRVAYSPDNQKLAVTGADGHVRIFSAVDGKPLDDIDAKGDVAMACFTPDSRNVVTGGETGLVDVWRYTSPTAVRTLTGHGGGVYGLHFSPDGTRLASCSADGTIRLWNLEAGNQAASLTGHEGQVSGIDFSPDGALLVSCGQDQSVRLWDVAGARQLKQLAAGDREIYSVAFSDDGKTIATGGVDKQLRIFDVLTGQLARMIPGHEDYIYRVAFSPKSGRLLSCGYSGHIAIWNPASGQELFEHELGEVTYTAAYSPDGKQLVIPSADGRLYFVDVPVSAQ